METLLALDLGTSGCRAELFGLDGHGLARCHREYPLLSPERGVAEQNPEVWWQSLVACVREALGQVEQPEVLAVGVSAQGHSWLPVDAHLRPLRHAMTWLDTRSSGQAQRLLDEYGPEFWGQVAGKLPGQWHMLPQLLWVREHEPEALAEASHYLCAHDYLIARMTGQTVTDYTNAATTLLFDIAEAEWSPPLLRNWHVDPATLPKVKAAGSIAGLLLPEIAVELGLPPRTPVAVGAQDQKCAALAAGLAKGTATGSLGTATAVTALVATPGLRPEHGAIPCFPYLQAGQWVLEAPLATSGGALRWLRDATKGLYSKMLPAASQISPGAGGVRFFPYLAGAAAPFWHESASGGFCGLTLRHGRAHLTRALLEAVAYDVATNLERMRASDCAIERLILFGGGTRSKLWPEIIAAVCDVPTLKGNDAEAATRGAAMLAAMSMGMDPTALKLQLWPVQPRASWRQTYQRLRRDYDRARSLYFEFDARLRERT